MSIIISESAKMTSLDITEQIKKRSILIKPRMRTGTKGNGKQWRYLVILIMVNSSTIVLATRHIYLGYYHKYHNPQKLAAYKPSE